MPYSMPSLLERTTPAATYYPDTGNPYRWKVNDHYRYPVTRCDVTLYCKSTCVGCTVVRTYVPRH
jgi:hypothetical protein